MPLGASFFENVLLMEFIYLVFTHMPGGVTMAIQVFVVVALFCWPFSAIISLCLLILHKRSRPHFFPDGINSL